jgi:P-type Ca2+ transporter type 2C
VIHCLDLSADESSLTGEQEPKDKTSDPIDISDDAMVSCKRNIVFMGTLVTTGSAQAVVISTSLSTEFGKTFQDMKDVEVRKTPLQVTMDDLGKRLSIMSFIIIVCIALLGVLQGKRLLNMFNIGVSLAVAAIPEGLPICVTVTLALGVMRMAKRNAICKKLPAVEALGCANYICTDKTGTLTENKITVVRAFCPSMDDYVLFHSENKNTNSGGQSPSSSSAIPSVSLWYSGRSASDVRHIPGLYSALDAFCLCNNAHLTSDGIVIGQPTEGALLLAAMATGVPDRRSSLTRVAEGGFSSDRKRMEITCVEAGGEVTYVKGAAEILLPDCTHYISSAGELHPLGQHLRERVNHQMALMTSEGLRVLLVASADTKQVLEIFLVCLSACACAEDCHDMTISVSEPELTTTILLNYLYACL